MSNLIMMGRNGDIRCPVQVGQKVRIKKNITKSLGVEECFLGSVCEVEEVYNGWEKFRVLVEHENGLKSLFVEEELDQRFYKNDLRRYE